MEGPWVHSSWNMFVVKVLDVKICCQGKDSSWSHDHRVVWLILVMPFDMGKVQNVGVRATGRKYFQMDHQLHHLVPYTTKLRNSGIPTSVPRITANVILGQVSLWSTLDSIPTGPFRICPNQWSFHPTHHRSPWLGVQWGKHRCIVVSFRLQHSSESILRGLFIRMDSLPGVSRFYAHWLSEFESTEKGIVQIRHSSILLPNTDSIVTGKRREASEPATEASMVVTGPHSVAWMWPGVGHKPSSRLTFDHLTRWNESSHTFERAHQTQTAASKVFTRFWPLCRCLSHGARLIWFGCLRQRWEEHPLLYSFVRYRRSALSSWREVANQQRNALIIGLSTGTKLCFGLSLQCGFADYSWLSLVVRVLTVGARDFVSLEKCTVALASVRWPLRMHVGKH